MFPNLKSLLDGTILIVLGNKGPYGLQSYLILNLLPNFIANCCEISPIKDWCSPRLATLLPHVLAPASLPCPQAPPPFSS